MAKGQQRGNREMKKPKATTKKPLAGAPAAPYQLAAQTTAKPAAKAPKK